MLENLKALAVIAAILMVGTNAGADEGGVFKVGVLLCLTGGCAEVGTNALNGAKLAAEEINAVGGVLGKKIELVVQDTHESESGSSAVTAFQNLVLDKDIRYLIGPTWTVGGLPLVPLLKSRRDLIVTSPSLGVAEFNESSDFVFNLWPHDSASTSALARYAVEKGWVRAAVFGNQGPWESAQAKAFSEAFEKLGGSVVASVEPLGESRDLRAEALKIKSANPQVVFMSNYTQMDIAARELKRLHYEGRILAILMDETRLKAADGALEGAIFARYPEPKAEFAARFSERYGSAPGIAADTGYDAIMIYRASIESSRTFDPEIVKSTIPKLSHSGASGTVEFDSRGGVVKQPQIWTVRNAVQEYIEDLPVR